MNRDALRILRVLKDGGPRKPNILQAMLRASAARFERAVGQLFIAGVVRWVSRKRWRMLAAVSK